MELHYNCYIRSFIITALIIQQWLLLKNREMVFSTWEIVQMRVKRETQKTMWIKDGREEK
jgi:hypothetical protein